MTRNEIKLNDFKINYKKDEYILRNDYKLDYKIKNEKLGIKTTPIFLRNSPKLLMKTYSLSKEDMKKVKNKVNHNLKYKI